MAEPVPPDIRNIVGTAMSAYGNAQSDGLGRQWDIYAAMNFAEQAIMADRAARPAIDAETVEACAKVADEYVLRPNLLPLCSEEMNKGAERGQYEAAEEIAAAIRSLSPASQGDDTAGRKG